MGKAAQGNRQEVSGEELRVGRGQNSRRLISCQRRQAKRIKFRSTKSENSKIQTTKNTESSKTIPIRAGFGDL
jgi:hypothetical protein